MLYGRPITGNCDVPYTYIGGAWSTGSPLSQWPPASVGCPFVARTAASVAQSDGRRGFISGWQGYTAPKKGALHPTKGTGGKAEQVGRSHSVYLEELANNLASGGEALGRQARGRAPADFHIGQAPAVSPNWCDTLLIYVILGSTWLIKALSRRYYGSIIRRGGGGVCGGGGRLLFLTRS